MIKPPFTVLILKDSHHPVTIRITIGFILTICVFITVVSMVIGMGMFYFVNHTNMQTIETSVNSSTVDYLPVPPENTHIFSQPDIRTITVKPHKNDGTEVTILFSSLSETMTVFVWLIVNPHSISPVETIIYPRSPIFRGLPVDYRNGMKHLLTGSDALVITLSDQISPVNFQQLRILVYTSDGDILIDKKFSENKSSKT